MTALIDATTDERDRVLVERHQAGDSSAFAELYTLHYVRLIGFCRRLVRDPHIAEEITQDAFVRAFTTLDRLGGERRFYPWLTVIARRLVIDHVRRHGRVQPRSDIEPEHAGAAEDLVVERLEGGHLLTALDRVRDRHREVLHLRDWEGLSYEAIAERLGLAPTAVPPLLHRARAALRREYLLVTEGRVAAFLPLTAVVAAVRRMRDRLGQMAAWMPDPGAMSAPIAGLVLSVGTMSAGLTVGPSPAPDWNAATATLQWSTPLDGPQRRAPHAPASGTGRNTPASTAAGPPQPTEANVLAPFLPEVRTDGEGRERARAQGKGRPVFVETEDAFIWLDPIDDLRKIDQGLDTTRRRVDDAW